MESHIKQSSASSSMLQRFLLLILHLLALRSNWKVWSNKREKGKPINDWRVASFCFFIKTSCFFLSVSQTSLTGLFNFSRVFTDQWFPSLWCDYANLEMMTLWFYFLEGEIIPLFFIKLFFQQMNSVKL